MQNIIHRFDHPNGVNALVFEDNGRVAYAYLVEMQRIVADVWLYNNCPAPDEPEWRHSKSMPYANSKAYIADYVFEVPSSLKDINVHWNNSGSNEALKVFVFIRGILHATLTPGEKPGHCRLASKDGPLAKMLSDEDN